MSDPSILSGLADGWLELAGLAAGLIGCLVNVWGAIEDRAERRANKEVV